VPGQYVCVARSHFRGVRARAEAGQEGPRALAGEAKPDPRAAREDSPVIGELVNDSQTPATVSAGRWAGCQRDIPLIGYLDAHPVGFDIDPQRDRADPVQQRVADQLRD
jgi:hypothetical protein